MSATSTAASEKAERVACNLAFAVGMMVLLYGLVDGADGYLIGGAVLYSGSLIATAIRDGTAATAKQPEQPEN